MEKVSDYLIAGRNGHWITLRKEGQLFITEIGSGRVVYHSDVNYPCLRGRKPRPMTTEEQSEIFPNGITSLE